MSQRNPMNDRYRDEEHHGKTRKSAASAKPKSQAAASVYVKPKTKTKQEKKAIRRAERQKENEAARKYANPPTEEYRRLRKIWWVLLIGAVACLALSFFLRDALGEFGFMVVLVLSYVFIIAALWLEFSKMKKVRNEYRARMEGKKTKAQRAQERREKAEAKAAKAEAEQKYEESKAAEAEKKGKGVLGGLFGGKKKAAEQDASASEPEGASLEAKDGKASASDSAKK